MSNTKPRSGEKVRASNKCADAPLYVAKSSQGVKRKLKGNVSNETKLLEAAFKGKDSVIAKLLKKQIDLNCRDVNESDCPLHIAAENGHLEFCTTLIKNGANVNIQVSSSGETPLHCAVIGENLEIVKLLLRNNANVHLYDKTDVSPICLAIHMPNEEAFKEMLSRADVNATNQKGNAMLHEAAIAGNHKATVALLAKGADINKQNLTGNTPLHLAALHGRTGVIAALMAYSPDLRIENRSGLTSSACAFQSGHKDLAALLTKSHVPNPSRQTLDAKTAHSFLELGSSAPVTSSQSFVAQRRRSRSQGNLFAEAAPPTNTLNALSISPPVSRTGTAPPRPNPEAINGWARSSLTSSAPSDSNRFPPPPTVNPNTSGGFPPPPASFPQPMTSPRSSSAVPLPLPRDDGFPPPPAPVARSASASSMGLPPPMPARDDQAPRGPNSSPTTAFPPPLVQPTSRNSIYGSYVPTGQTNTSPNSFPPPPSFPSSNGRATVSQMAPPMPPREGGFPAPPPAQTHHPSNSNSSFPPPIQHSVSSSNFPAPPSPNTLNRNSLPPPGRPPRDDLVPNAQRHSYVSKTPPSFGGPALPPRDGAPPPLPRDDLPPPPMEYLPPPPGMDRADFVANSLSVDIYSLPPPPMDMGENLPPPPSWT